jgi:cysteine synthase
VRLFRIVITGIEHTIALKEEGLNPFGSIQDRVAWRLIVEACNSTTLGPTEHLVCASSGNFGVSVAGLGRALRLPVSVVADADHLTEINRQAILLSGAKLHTLASEASGGTGEAQWRTAQEIAQATGGFLLNYRTDPANPATHRDWTAPEALAHTQRYDAIFLSTTTGGTLRGFADYLIAQQRSETLIAVDDLHSNALETPVVTESPEFLPEFGSAQRTAFEFSAGEYQLLRIPTHRALAAFSAVRALGLAPLGVSSCAILVGCLNWLAQQDERKKVLCVCPDGLTKYSNNAVLSQWAAKLPGYEASLTAMLTLLKRVKLTSVQTIAS